MRNMLIATGLATTLIVPTTALADRVIFLGSLVYTETANCEFDRTGDSFAARFHPSSVGDNPSGDALSLFTLTGAENYTMAAGGRFKAAWSPVLGTTIYNYGDHFQARIRITSSTPVQAQIKPTTNFVSLVGQIETASADPGVGGKKCVATFRAGLTRRIEN